MSPAQFEDTAPWLDQEHPGDWAVLVRLLSLDLTRSMRGYLDLDLDSSLYDTLVDVMREAVVEEPEAADAAPPSRLGDKALGRAEARFGRHVAGDLRCWGNTAFRYAYRDRSRYDFWSILLAQCRRDRGLWASLSLPPKQSAAFESRFLNAQDDSRFTVDYREATKGQLSAWDLQMHLNDAFHDGGNEPSTPEILLRSLAAVQRNRGFWQWVVSTFSATALEELHRHAEALIRERPQFAFITDLVAPRTLALSCSRTPLQDTE
jgi:hypothetical protein